MHRELKIPSESLDCIGFLILTGIVVPFTALGIVNLLSWDAPIASGLWVALVSAVTWSSVKEAGGWRPYFINRLGDLVDNRFIETNNETCPNELRLGFTMYQHRFIQQIIPLDSVETVEWNTGQATDIAGRDMDDWHVVLWFDRNDPSKRNQYSRKPDQDLVIIGPSGPKAKTQQFGLTVVEFLQQSGAHLVLEKETRFIRGKPSPTSSSSSPATA